MLFQFQLRALTDVMPWGSDEQQYLHWFGLTDGWYWMQMGENNEFFRYSPQILAYWRKNYPEYTISCPYVDYQVVRLWEDLLEMLPAVLEPLPPQLAQMVEIPEQVSRWQERTSRWEKEIAERGELGTEIWDTYSDAVNWWSHRQLNTGYLTASPHLWLWNDGTAIQCCWDSTQTSMQDVPVWESQRGQVQLTHTQFLEEVHSFHTRLFVAMEERIQKAKRAWPRPDVALDMPALEKEQHDRAQWLARSLNRASSGNATHWNTVIEAISTLEKHSEPV